MNTNAKSELLELLKNLGCSENNASFQPIPIAFNLYSSTVTVIFPNGLTLQGSSESKRSSEADIAAAQIVLNQIYQYYPELSIDWDKIDMEAQLGDALIKLSVYLSDNYKNVNDKSKVLQNLESDSNLGKVFDRWKSQDDPNLVIWGNNLGEKRKATLVEALLWRRFETQVLTINASERLKLLLKTLQ